MAHNSEEEAWPQHSTPLDPKLWKDNPNYFTTLTPRINKHPQISDDAVLQCQIDMFGKDHVGVLAFACLSSIAGGWASLIYPESSPERLQLIAYFHEILVVQDDFGILDTATHPTGVIELPQHIWVKERSQQAFRKIKQKILEFDEEVGKALFSSLEKWARVDKVMKTKFGEYEDLEEYLQDRYHDIAWPHCLLCIALASNVQLTQEEEASIQHVLWPMLVHGILTNDYFSWDKEYRAHVESNGEVPVINAVALLMRWEGLSVEDAKTAIRARCLEVDREYSILKQKYMEEHKKGVISPSLRRWFDCFEWFLAGHNAWCMAVYRYNSRDKDHYLKYYSKRCDEGAVWFDDCTQSTDLLSGGLGVRCKAKDVVISS